MTSKSEVSIKAGGPKDRKDLDISVRDYTGEFIPKENNSSTKNKEAKLRTTADKEC